jgi:hypothetical protein
MSVHAADPALLGTIEAPGYKPEGFAGRAGRFMRTGVVLFAVAVVLSALLHGALLLVSVAWTGEARSFAPLASEPVMVDIVAPQELAQAAKPEAKPDAKPELAKQTKSPLPETPASRPPPQESKSPFDPTKLAAMFPVSPVAGAATETAPPGVTGFDAPAEKAAKLSAEDVAAFKAHLRKCWTSPAGVSAADKMRIVYRISLKPDGALGAQPMLLEATASPNGPAMAQSVERALRQCQPYNFLPADKYVEWKVLDVSLSPGDLAGG